MHNYKIAIAGLGTVGGALVNMILAQEQQWAADYNLAVTVVAIAKRNWSDEDRKLADKAQAQQLTNVSQLIDTGVDCIVELIGGTTTAYDLIQAAINANISVVTANKAVLSEHGDAIFDNANQHKVAIGYEASVAGAIPILRALRGALATDTFDDATGVINGTCNYILTRMETEQADLAPILADAQALGYAEADPGADIDGWDAAHKLSIISRITLSTPLDVKSLDVTGIREVSLQDINTAIEMGYRLRLIGRVENREQGITAYVAPALLPSDHPLAALQGPENCIVCNLRFAGRISLQGPGAGGNATASAVASDIVQLALNRESHDENLPKSTSPATAKPILQNATNAWYLRINVADSPGVLATITALCADIDVNIAELIQHKNSTADNASIALATDMITAEQTQNLVTALADQGFAHAVKFPIVQG